MFDTEHSHIEKDPSPDDAKLKQRKKSVKVISKAKDISLHLPNISQINRNLNISGIS